MFFKRTLFVFLFLFAWFTLNYAQDNNKPLNLKELQTNQWISTKCELSDIKTILSDPKARWEQTDGYSNSIFRSKTNTVLIRTGVHSEVAGYTPGYYTNTTAEWHLAENKIELLEISNWGGGSYGSGKLLPAYKEHPTPSPRHTYDGICYVEPEDSMYMLLGAAWKTGLGEHVSDEAKAELKRASASLWKLDLTKKRWSEIPGGVQSVGYKDSDFENHLRYWPQKNKLLFFDSSAKFYATFDIASQKWAKEELKNKSPMSLYNTRSTWDSKRNLWVFRLGNLVCTFNPETREFASLPEPYKIEEKKDNPRVGIKGIVYLPKLDGYFLSGLNPDDCWFYSPEKNLWHQVKATGPELPNGYLNYNQVLDCITLNYQLQMFVFKLSID